VFTTAHISSQETTLLALYRDKHITLLKPVSLVARKAELAHCAHTYHDLRRATFNNTHFQITEK
jgi:hypothetical protein